MPLRIKCSHCARVLLLEDAFRGAGCRCQFCRGYMRVPVDSVTPPARIRPDHPPHLSSGIVATAAVGPRRPNAQPMSVATSSHGLHRFVSTRSAQGGFLAAACGLIAVAVWSVVDFSSPDGTPRTPHMIPPVAVAPESMPGESSVEWPTAPPPLARTYFGVPVDGNLVAYIVDTDEAMKPYIGDLSFVTNLVNKSVFTGRRERFGIIRPGLSKRFSLMDVAERPGTLEDSETLLAARLPPESTDVYEALGVAFNSYADQVFLVLAKPLNADEVSRLTHRAEQTGAVTNVLALGPAARLDLSPIATATGGRYTALSDAQWNEWVTRYKSVAP